MNEEYLLDLGKGAWDQELKKDVLCMMYYEMMAIHLKV